jgi:predicted CXXCH cytochrome family protein
MPRTVAVAVLLAASVAAACGSPPVTEAPRSAGAAQGDSSVVASNVLRQDYAGSQACEPCHPDIHEKWQHSPMRGMTRLIEQAAVAAPFDGGLFRFKQDAVRFEQHDGRRYMRVERAGEAPELWRVTKVIGGRYREDFAGVDLDAGGDEVVLPVSWLIGERAWRYKGYSVLARERPGLRAGPVWRTTCIFCHNTVPYLSLVLDDLSGPRTPGYQGSITDTLLPDERRWRVVPTDEAGVARAVAEEIRFLGFRRPSGGEGLERLLDLGRKATRQRFDEPHLVEVGIGCEACHLGAAAHAADPEVRPTFEVRSPLLAYRPPPGAGPPTRAEVVNRTCLRCHAVLFSQYPYTWEGGRRHGEAGGSSINSGEARDLLLGGCQQLSCADCHDPHAEDDRARLASLATPAGNRVCTRCHTDLAADERVAQHGRHDPAGPAGSCVACHMPRKNMGLGYELTRYHRIGSPTDRARVEGDRPLECALCHADATVGDLVDAMERWWGKRYDRDALARLYGGDLGVNALRATLERGLPHEQGTAAASLGEQGATDAAPLLVPLLAHEIPLVRFFARHALARLVGRPLLLDLDLPREEILRQARAWLE